MEERNEAVFVDSNYFIGLFNEEDPLFARANRIGEKLIRKSTPLCISNFIFLEITTVISLRVSRRIAVETGKYLLSHSQIRIIHIDEALSQSTWDIFQSIEHKNISFVDCSILAVMKSEGIRELLTFDTTDFKKLQSKHRFSFYGLPSEEDGNE